MAVGRSFWEVIILFFFVVFLKVILGSLFFLVSSLEPIYLFDMVFRGLNHLKIS